MSSRNEAPTDGDIVETIIDDDLSKFDTLLRARLWTLRKEPALTQLLLSSFLIEAIRHGSAQACAILLDDFKANPVPVRDRNNPNYIAQPLAEALSYSKFARHIHVDKKTGRKSTNACEILRLLFKHGVTFQKCQEHDMFCPVFPQIFILAANAPDAAELLVRQLPVDIYLKEIPHKLSPLDNFIQYFLPVYLTQDDLTPLFKMLKYGVLPLLRLGATVNCSFEKIPALPSLLEVDHLVSQLCWNRPFILVKIFIETTWTSACGVRQSDCKVFGQSLSSIIAREFPRTLQRQCRCAILRRLVVGPARAEAIERLELPTSLKNYLNFHDYNIDI